MKIYKETSEHLWLFCPSHNDVKTGNLCVNKTDSGDYPKGYSYCYACGFTMQFSKEAVDKMSKKKSICRKKIPIDWTGLSDKYHVNIDAVDKIAKLSKSWNVGIDSFLTYPRIGYDDEAITIPMRNEYGNIIGIHRRFPDGSKSCVDGSQLGLFISTVGGYKIAITEGFSDAVIATHLGFVGVGKPSASFGHELIKKLLEYIFYEQEIIIVQDNDEAGRKSTEKLQSVLQNWDTRVVVPESDLKDYYLKYGFDQTVKLLEK